MKKVVKDLSLAAILALLWFGSAYFAAEVWLPTSWAIACGFVNALIGTAALAWVTRTEEGARLFYEGPGNREGWIVIALLWSIPSIIAILGLIWWGLRLVLQWLGWWRF
ncbi:MAG: hypothetical protein KJ077_07650 [Anaerolineae bacterium]|nr:hypothetical protein [Anaerolineae bacterium]